MRTRKWMVVPVLALCGWVFAQDAEQQRGGYANDFQNETVGALPKDMMVLAGEFTIAEEAGNKFLLLPGSPLESFGLLVGPEQAASCQTRIRATSTGKRTPEFGVGLAGAAGYKLWLMPATNELQIIKGEERVAKLPYNWTSGSWTVMRVELRHMPDGKTRVEGKAWPQDQQEPKEWMIGFDDAEAGSKGRASVWGTPYSDTPIAFDDLRATTQAR
jgi:hypothetical protein